jgi:hypothetical protein
MDPHYVPSWVDAAAFNFVAFRGHPESYEFGPVFSRRIKHDDDPEGHPRIVCTENRKVYERGLRRGDRVKARISLAMWPQCFFVSSTGRDHVFYTFFFCAARRPWSPSPLLLRKGSYPRGVPPDHPRGVRPWLAATNKPFTRAILTSSCGCARPGNPREYGPTARKRDPTRSLQGDHPGSSADFHGFSFPGNRDAAVRSSSRPRCAVDDAISR